MAVKYLVSGADGDHLPYTGEDGKPDHRLMGAAWAALHGGYRGNKYDGSNKLAAIEKLKGVYKSEGMEPPAEHASHSDNALNNQWVEIFRAGNYGDKGNYTPEDLDRLSASYDPKFHEAPVVIGHPEDNAPAFGWVDKLRRSGDVLLAKFRDVNDEFADMVKRGLFKKRSASFYRKADGLQLRHVGFLGAQPPEVKGLAAIKFEDSEATEFVFQEEQMAQEKTVAEQIADFFREKFGAKPDPKTFSESEVKAIATQAATEAVKPLQEKLDAQAKDFAEREKKFASADTQSRADVLIGKLKAAGKWIPAFDKLGVPLAFAELAKVTTTVEFGEEEKDGKKVPKQMAPVDVLFSFFEQLPKIVPAGELYDGRRVGGHSPVKGISPGRAEVDQNSVQLSELAHKRAKEDKIEFTEALSLVAQEHPELTQPGRAVGGAV